MSNSVLSQDDNSIAFRVEKYQKRVEVAMADGLVKDAVLKHHRVSRRALLGMQQAN